MPDSYHPRRNRRVVSIFHILTMLLVLTVSFASTSQAQTSLGTIKGAVTEPSDALVPGATVTITNEGTGLIWVTMTNDSGHYAIEGMNLGTYEVLFSFTGFSDVKKTNITVRANQMSI